MKESLEFLECETEGLYYEIPSAMIEKYDFQKTKENVEELISEYKKAKFECLVSENALSKITTCYQPKYNQSSFNSQDKLGSNVAKNIDSKEMIGYFEDIFNPLFTLLTMEERKFYSLGLINNNSEQFICDIIGISRTGLQPIKQNCILKIALSFHIAILK